MSDAEFADLVGVTLKEVRVDEVEDQIRFVAEDGREWLMHHPQLCCENVVIDDICGSIDDLIGSPITQAEESTNEPTAEEVVPEERRDAEMLWTFYRVGTAKGLVVLRWWGSSNGYYGVGVDFDLVKEAENA